MSYNLFIDDDRYPPLSWERHWAIARSSKQAIALFYNHGPPNFISFDHDLGNDDTSIKYIDWIIDLALNLIDLGVDKKIIKFPKNFTVHSQNPIGAQNIEHKMKNFIQFLENQ